jgi:hypothetical protein
MVGALYEKSRKYERPRFMSEAIFVILNTLTDFSQVDGLYS